MGFYINPTGMSKEEWLQWNGEYLPDHLIEDCLDKGECFPVCLVSNGAFTAAGICYDRHELEAFTLPHDTRPKIWFSVSKEKLEDFIPDSFIRKPPE